MHDNDKQQAHLLDLLVSELLADEAGQFGIRYDKLALVGLGTNLALDAGVVLEELALEDSYFGGHAARRYETGRTEHLLGVVFEAETVSFQTLDPVLAGRAVAGDREVDDSIFLTPRSLLLHKRRNASQYVSVLKNIRDVLLNLWSCCSQLRQINPSHPAAIQEFKRRRNFGVRRFLNEVPHSRVSFCSEAVLGPYHVSLSALRIILQNVDMSILLLHTSRFAVLFCCCANIYRA